MTKTVLDSRLELKVDSIDLDRTLTHKEYCPKCIYNPESGSCPQEHYTFSLNYCFNFTEEDTAERYLQKHCTICAKPKVISCKAKKDLEWAVKNKKDHKRLKNARFTKKRIIFTDEDLRFINNNCRVDHHHFYKELLKH